MAGERLGATVPLARPDRSVAFASCTFAAFKTAVAALIVEATISMAAREKAASCMMVSRRAQALRRSGLFSPSSARRLSVLCQRASVTTRMRTRRAPSS